MRHCDEIISKVIGKVEGMVEELQKITCKKMYSNRYNLLHKK